MQYDSYVFYYYKVNLKPEKYVIAKLYHHKYSKRPQVRYIKTSNCKIIFITY